MARGPSERAIPLLVSGSIDTKTNPKLVQPPGLLELENMYQLRTGEFTPRNGFTRQIAGATFNIQSGANLFQSAAGGLATIAQNWKSATTPGPVALKFGALTDPTFPGWAPNEGATSGACAYPWASARVSGAKNALGVSGGPTAVDFNDPDIAATNLSLRVSYYTETNNTTATEYWDANELGTLRPLPNQFNPSAITAVAGYLPKVAATGTGSHVAFFAKTAANTLSAARFDASGTAIGSATIATDLAANGFFDVKPIPGTTTIAVAWAVSTGGIKCAIFTPSTGGVASVVATAGADPSLCMGWLDDQTGSGLMLLATAGTVNGVIVRVMSAATMVVSATNTIDATATAGVRNITGHTTSATPNYIVAWDVDGSAALYDKIKIGIWTGSATVRDFYGNHSLYSRSFKLADGRYYMVGFLTSTVQAQYTLISFDGTLGATRGIPACSVLAGEGGAKRRACTLASSVAYNSTAIVAATRLRKITAPDGSTAAPQKTIAYLTFGTSTAVTHAREVGGTVFIPGGVLHRDDSETIEPATFPIYPEILSGTSSNAGGSMTASGAYAYRQVFRTIDINGRVTRSAGSVTFSITLGAGDNRVSLNCFNLKAPRGSFNTTTSGHGTIISEIYRRGPASTGATLYNKVGEVLVDLSSGGDTTTFVDTMSDTNAAAGEVAYFNGNVLENFNPPAHSLLEVNGNRVGIVSAEDPTEFWFSKEYKAGAGIGFNPLLKVAISGDGAGDLTALASMDGRWILFKRTAIYVLSGDGPNDLGQGSFNSPQAVSRTLGTTNPASVIETPDGIIFQADDGRMWLLDRGLGVQYIGGPVESYTLSTPAVGAALGPLQTTVRFVFASGLMLEWDYFHKKWYRHVLVTEAHTVVACATTVLHGFCYLLDNGDLLKEIAASVADVYSTTTAIVPVVSFPHLQLAGLAGYQRLYRIEFTLDAIASHTFKVDGYYDLSDSAASPSKTIALTTGNGQQVEYNPLEGKAKCTSIRPRLTVTGTPTSGTFRLTGATLYVAVKRGTNVSPAQRMT